MTQDKHSADRNSFTEKVEIVGSSLVATVKNLMADASVRRVVIRNAEGRQLLSIPMTAGIAGGAVAILLAPLMSALAVLGGAVAKLKLEIVRTGEPKH